MTKSIFSRKWQGSLLFLKELVKNDPGIGNRALSVMVGGRDLPEIP
jgi:hypothetical protein